MRIVISVGHYPDDPAQTMYKPVKMVFHEYIRKMEFIKLKQRLQYIRNMESAPYSQDLQ